MYPHMIEVHDEDGSLITINIDSIEWFNKDQVIMLHCQGINVCESYDELKQLIRDAGCHIAKKDPRLDDKPMEWDDFPGQEGEIFWNSNTRDWYKYDRIIELKDGTKWLGFLGFDGIMYEVYPEDLKAKPMYRMKVKDEPESLPF